MYTRLFSVLSFLVSTTFFVHAQNFTVNTQGDSPDINLADGICEDGAGNCSLRAAVMESNALGGAHEISLPDGIYTLSIPGQGEDLSATGDIDMNSDITITGTSASGTVINADSLDRVFHILPGNAVEISLITIEEGYAFPGNGGGILNEGALALNQLHISNNTCELNPGGNTIGGFGGGISNEGELNASRITVFDNVAKGGIGTNGSNGGGGGGSTPGFGGGIYNGGIGNVILENCTISSNLAVGGRYSNGSTNGGNFTMAGNPGAGPNGGTGGAGGGGAGGNATGDYSGGGGGGSSGGFGGTGGIGGYGGGGGGRGAKSGGGSSGAGGLGGFGGGQGSGPCCSSGGGGGAGAGLGGGIFNNGGNIISTNLTIAYNKAQGGQGRFLNATSGFAAGGTDGEGYGGGIFNRSGTVDLNNSLIAYNKNINDIENANLIGIESDEDLFGSFTSTSGSNLVFNMGAGTLGGNTTGNIISADPLLMSLADNGGTTFTHAILPCPQGPAVNAGNDVVAPALDQREMPRNEAADIGSFESDLAQIDLSYSMIQPCENTSNGSITVTPQSTPEYTYQWDAASGNQTESTAIDLSAGFYNIMITDGNGCVKDTTFELVSAPNPTIDPVVNQEECEFFTLIEITGTNLSGDESYYTESGGLGTSLTEGDVITSTQTIYMYDLLGNCDDEVSFDVIIHELPEVLSFTGEGEYCEGQLPQNIIVEVSGTPDFTLDYTINGAQTSIVSSEQNIDLGNTPGVYMITGIQDEFCENTSDLTQSIIVHLLPSAPETSGDQSFCTNEMILPIEAQGEPGSHSWYSDEGLTQLLSPEDQYLPENTPGIYTYYVTSTENDCEGPAQAVVIEIKICDVVIPTAFTPNTDGVNDTWNIVNLDLVYPNNVVSVYNRLGNKVFESQKGKYQEMPWNGFYNLEALPVASYYYIIEYNDENNKSETGYISIIK
ncbi:gliding motility-associated C-terminal domain-containing protein [Crocinitomicaceae bacterium]|nr:gliding motility-associated C-terminal domain-containing protein [Crocinitomicaceae bacterium]